MGSNVTWFQALLSFAARCKGKMILLVLCSIVSVFGGFVPFFGVYQILQLFIAGEGSQFYSGAASVQRAI